jgi:CheY-like chemotaxis protein
MNQMAVTLRSNADAASKEIVLIIDDDADFVAQLAQILSDNGYLVLSALDGKAAATLVEQRRQDLSLVIVDLFLPNINGFEFIGLLRRNKLNLKIIATSAARQKVLDTAFAVGADATVKKPEPGARLDVQQWLDAVSLEIGLPKSAPT